MWCDQQKINSNLLTKLKESTMKELFYYMRDETNAPIITVCLLVIVAEMLVIARGVAICSDLDTPCKKQNIRLSNGPGIALRRAHKANDEGKNSMPINRPEAVDIISDVSDDNYQIWDDLKFPGIFHHKAFFLPTLSPREVRILSAAVK